MKRLMIRVRQSGRTTLVGDPALAAVLSLIDGLRRDVVAYRVVTDARLEALERAARVEVLSPSYDDRENKARPWPPGNWVRMKIAVAYSEYSESGIRSMVKRGIIKDERRGGRVYVNMDDIPGVKKCEKT